MKLYIGVTNDDELLYIDWDKCENEQRETFSLSGGTYREPKTETEGEAEARERLSTRDYWEEIDMIKGESFLNDYINFDEVADKVLSSDGWENTNGEYSHFGEVENEEIYLNFSSCGQHQEKRDNVKALWIDEADFKKINKLWDDYHLSGVDIGMGKKGKITKEELNKVIKKMSSIFEKYKSLCSDKDTLIKYLDVIKWRQ